MAKTNKRWRRIDRRGLVGVALVFVAVAGTWLTVRAVMPQQSYAVAAVTLLPGDTVKDSDLRYEAISMVGGGESYLEESGDDLVGAVVSEPVAAGELVPRRVVQDEDQSGHSRIVITGGVRTPATVTAGTRVDLWQSADSDDGEDASVLVSRALVVSVEESRTFGGADPHTNIEVLIRTDAIADVVTAESDGGEITIVQSAGSER
ncbi:MAG: hypothetical protein ACTJHU_08270 [Mycetocola sp.]